MNYGSVSIILSGVLAVTLGACQPTVEQAERPARPTADQEDPTPQAREPEAEMTNTDTCTGSATATEAFAGFWSVGTGAPQFGAHTETSGTNDVTLRSSNGGLTMTIEGFPTVRLQRMSRSEGDWNWPTGSDVAVTPADAVIVAGCQNQQEFARFRGTARVEAEGGGSAMTTFRLMMYTPDEGILHWEMGPPMQSSGLFAISRAR